MSNNANVGYLFNKDYFQGLDYLNKDKDTNEKKLNLYIKNSIIHRKWDNSDKNILIQLNESEILEKFNGFKLVTTYPGLLVGAGMEHEVNIKGEVKLGFYFDYTSGMPIIPGSSVKGVIRSAFPQWNKHIKDTPKEIKVTKTLFIKSLLISEDINNLEFSKKVQDEIQAIESEIFEGIINGEPLSIYDRDIFHDALITNASQYPNTIKQILGTDSITPHIHDGMSYEKSMLKNPIPLPFIKVLPGVEFMFQFDLKDNGGLSPAQKLDLFQKILLNTGIGAKTNVGYGQFSNALSKKKVDILTEVNVDATQEKPGIKYLIDIPFEITKRFKKDTVWNAKLFDMDEKYFYFELIIDKKTVILKKDKEKVKEKIEINSKVILKFNQDTVNNNFNYKVIPK